MAGSVSATATISVVEQAATEQLVAPSFVMPLAGLRVMDGEEVQFTCEVRVVYFHLFTEQMVTPSGVVLSKKFITCYFCITKILTRNLNKDKF